MSGLRARKDATKAKSPTSADVVDTPRQKKPSSKQPLLFAFLLFIIFALLVITLKPVTPPENSKPVKAELSKSLFNEGASKQVEKKGKRGKVLHKTITSVKKEDLEGVVDELPAGSESISYEDAIKGRERLVDMLHDAGVEELDVHTVLSLPKWESVSKLYGDEPVVVGLETCQKFRESTQVDDASIGPAGMFNTGTNPFAMYLEANCIMPHNTHDSHGGTRWQVPWGKHTMASQKLTNTASHEEKTNKTNVLPVAIVRDPYSWMQSLCKHPYAAKWVHTKEHCPNLAPSPEDYKAAAEKGVELDGRSIPVEVRYKTPLHFDSIAHYWVQWYKEYLEADYPRLLIRFEDLQFHPKEVVDLVCQCAGATARDPNGEFTYIVDSGKWGPGHRGKQTNLISAMIKYGSDANRFTGMTKEDMDMAAEAIDPSIMQLFHYEIPSL